VTELEELLKRAGCVPPSDGGPGKWTCPVCLHVSVVVNRRPNHYMCVWRKCTFFGSAETLKKQLSTLLHER
jgi:hypothetical protein